MSYLVMCVLLFFWHLALRLQWYTTVILFAYFACILHLHIRRFRKQKEEEQRFSDAGIYMDTLLYAFMKEGKIDAALADVQASLPDGKMKTTVQKALSHMRMTFDETEVIRDSLSIIEEAYSCKRIADIHDFMLHVEYYGGEMEKPVRLLLEDKERWSARMKKAMQERKKMFRDVVLSVITSLAICGMVLYLPVMNVDISSNLLTQILTVVVILLDDLVLFGAQSYLAVDWLVMDAPEQDKDYVKKMREYKQYDEKKEKRLSFILAAGAGVLAILLLAAGKKWTAAIGLLVFLLCLNQHKIGHYLAGKNLRKSIRCAFPNWLMDLVLLLQSENVQVALQKSMSHVPAVLRTELNTLLARLEMNPESSEPYHGFLKEFRLPEVSATMSMLYSLSVGNSGNAEQQVSELIARNLEMLELAETERLQAKNSGMYLLFLAPVLTASLKLVVDMAVFMLTFLSASVISV